MFRGFSTDQLAVLDSIVVSIPACHAGDQGSIPCRGVTFPTINDVTLNIDTTLF